MTNITQLDLPDTEPALPAAIRYLDLATDALIAALPDEIDDVKRHALIATLARVHADIAASVHAPHIVALADQLAAACERRAALAAEQVA